MQLLTDEFLELKALQEKGYKYLARDKDEALYAYRSLPNKQLHEWEIKDEMIEPVDFDLFAFINWEDDKPYNIENMLPKY